jgi:hypothetical protein
MNDEIDTPMTSSGKYPNSRRNSRFARITHAAWSSSRIARGACSKNMSRSSHGVIPAMLSLLDEIEGSGGDMLPSGEGDVSLAQSLLFESPASSRAFSGGSPRDWIEPPPPPSSDPCQPHLLAIYNPSGTNLIHSDCLHFPLYSRRKQTCFVTHTGALRLGRTELWTKLDQTGPSFDKHRNDPASKLFILNEIGSSGRTRTYNPSVNSLTCRISSISIL